MFGRNTGLMDIPAFKINSRDWPKAWYLANGVMLMMGWIRAKFTSLEQKRESECFYCNGCNKILSYLLRYFITQ